jgi:hypothetical protein
MTTIHSESSRAIYNTIVYNGAITTSPTVSLAMLSYHISRPNAHGQ